MIWPRNVTEEISKLAQENDQRLLFARRYLNFTTYAKKKPEKIEYESPNNLTDVVITVITVSRKTTVRGFKWKTYNPRYLMQTVSKLIQLLRSNSSTRVFNYGLMVCNVDSSPEAHEEVKALSSSVHTIVKYKNSSEVPLNRFEKEKQDYTYCLGKSLVYKPKYVLLMEDDAYPTNRLLSVLEYSIQNIFEGKFSEFSGQREKIAFLKLYHPERLLGFISIEFYRLFELAAAVSILLTVLTALNRKGVCNLDKPWRTILIAGIYIVLLALAIGRQNLMGLRRISRHFHSFVPAPSCCTPANLYPYNDAVALLSSFAGKVSYSGHAKDMLLDEFLREYKYKAIYVEPNIFQHIGQYSSLRQGHVLDPYVV